MRGIGGPAYDAVRVAHAARAASAAVPTELVVFKPDAARAAAIGGFAPDDFRRFVAVEPARVTPETALPGGGLAPGDAFELDATFTMIA